jgi:hypothetical protein
MKSLRFALSFLAIPRLFASLILLPLIIGLGVLGSQLFLTQLVISSNKNASVSAERRLEKLREESLARRLIYGSGGPRPPLRICRWSGNPEKPPETECSPDRLDVAIRLADNDESVLTEALARFEGYFDRVHICRSCTPDIIIDFASSVVPRTEVYSLQAYILFATTRYHPQIREDMIHVIGRFNETKELFGLQYFYAPGLKRPVLLDRLHEQVAVIISIASLMLISMFLGMKAHRRILEYFSRSGALLPMVASLGKSDFYRSLWILTTIRVLAFLLAGVPMLIGVAAGFQGKNETAPFMQLSVPEMGLWIVTLLSSFLLATIVASLADLRRRKEILSFLYTFIPFVLCILGALLWAISFLLPLSFAGTLRQVLTAVPILGIAPVLISPISYPGELSLLVHTFTSLLCTILLLRRNAMWFAAHLEDV